MIVGAIIFASGCLLGAVLVVAGQNVGREQNGCKCHERK